MHYNDHDEYHKRTGLFAPSLFDKFGVDWGMSVFALVGLALAASPLLFFYFGERLREKSTIDLDKV
jgi:hypothetical protein